MLLSVNLMLDERFAGVFDKSVQKAAGAAGMHVRAVRPEDLAGIRDLDAFSHLLLSGSEASVVDEQPWEGPLTRLVEAWLRTERPVLGICYGHQFLAKVCLGPGHVRRAGVREFGFRELGTRPHPLFDGLAAPVFLCCHQDEVFDLPQDCCVLAWSDLCQVQAASFGHEQVLGVQFHPEYGRLHGEDIFLAAESWCPGASSQVFREGRDPAALDGNWRMITNFLRMGSR